MPKPNMIKVGPLEYSIEWEDGLEVDGMLCHGVMASIDSSIRIDSSQPLMVQQVTLLHEALHAILTESGAADVLGIKQEEMVVRSISTQLIQMIQESPSLVSFITRKPRKNDN